MYERILVALDGSESSRYAGRAAIELARAMESRVIACHVYGVDIHQNRFADMEPGLPEKYQKKKHLSELRMTHSRLMDEGLKALSAGYLEDFAGSCRNFGINLESAVVEGRSYVGILNLAEKHKCDLIALGADGLGAIGNGLLGGTTTRVLQSTHCDVLVARRAPGSGPILTGVDGSEESLKGAALAVKLAAVLKRPVHMTAAYDPDFHTNVFHTMAKNLSPENQDKVGLMGQKKLHDEIINKGLGSLYEDFLREARNRFNGNGTIIKTFLVTGKAYCALESQARCCSAGLIVVSRHGHHRRQHSRLGSNAEGLLRTTTANVLLVGGAEDGFKGHLPVFEQHNKNVDGLSAKTGNCSPLLWDSDAEGRLQRMPLFVQRDMKTLKNSILLVKLLLAY